MSRRMWDEKEIIEIAEEHGGSGGGSGIVEIKLDSTITRKEAEAILNKSAVLVNGNGQVYHISNIYDYKDNTYRAVFKNTYDYAPILRGEYEPNRISLEDGKTIFVDLNFNTDTYTAGRENQLSTAYFSKDDFVVDGNYTLKLKEHGGSVKIDNKTIIEDEDGNIRTAIGGYIVPGRTDTFISNGGTTTNFELDLATATLRGDYSKLTLSYNETRGCYELIGGWDTIYFTEMTDRNITIAPAGTAVIADSFGTLIPVSETITATIPETVEPIDVKAIPVDGETIIVEDNKLKAVGGGGGEPAAYIKNASISGNTLTLVNKDDTTIEFTPDSGTAETWTFTMTDGTVITKQVVVK